MTPSSNGSQINYSYDNFSRQLTAGITSGQTLTFAYDQLSRQTSEQSSVLGTMAYQYDLAGRLTQMTWPDTSFYINYDYDLANEVTRVRESGATSGAGVLATNSYDNLGRRTAVSRGNGTSEAATFDAVSRLTQLDQDVASG